MIVRTNSILGTKKWLFKNGVYNTNYFGNNSNNGYTFTFSGYTYTSGLPKISDGVQTFNTSSYRNVVANFASSTNSNTILLKVYFGALNEKTRTFARFLNTTKKLTDAQRSEYIVTPYSSLTIQIPKNNYFAIGFVHDNTTYTMSGEILYIEVL